jgi:aromatic ring hydroxylase
VIACLRSPWTSSEAGLSACPAISRRTSVFCFGTNSIPAVQLRLADIIRFREAVRAHLIAADDTGFTTPGGLYKPNNLMFDFGRAYFNENSSHFVHEILDLSGRGPMMIPSERTWQVPELKEWLEPLMHGPHGEDDRLRVFRVVRDLFLTDWGRRNGMFDQFNGTPLTAVRLLTMMRSEFQVDGPLTELAREVFGLSYGDATDDERARDHTRAQDAKIT